jgi:TetR/AcrR family transcriptional regulator, transcriptional repressor for nem operon
MEAASHNPNATSKGKLLDAALQVIRSKGYSATTIDDICASASLTKGSFFHHFKSKEDLALAAIEHWNAMTGGLFAQSPYHQLSDPRERVFAYINLRAEILQGDLPDYTCLLGTLVQETYETHPRIRDACNAGITAHAHTVAVDIAAAKARYVPDATWDAETLALYTQAVLQGAFILAKAQGSSQIVAQCIVHLRRYVEGLLTPGAPIQPTQRKQS